MGLNKFITKKGRVLLDLTEDTVTPETLAKGATAHDRSGEPIVGTMEGGGGGGDCPINIVDELPEVGEEGAYYGLMTFTDLYIRDPAEGGFMMDMLGPSKAYIKKAPTLDLAEVQAKVENGGYVMCILYLTEYGDKPDLYTIGADEFMSFEDQMGTPFMGEITDTTKATEAGMYAYMSPVVYQYTNGAYKLSVPRE